MPTIIRRTVTPDGKPWSMYVQALDDAVRVKQGGRPFRWCSQPASALAFPDAAAAEATLAAAFPQWRDRWAFGPGKRVDFVDLAEELLLGRANRMTGAESMAVEAVWFSTRR